MLVGVDSLPVPLEVGLEVSLRGELAACLHEEAEVHKCDENRLKEAGIEFPIEHDQ